MNEGACLTTAPFAGNDFTNEACAQAGLNGASAAGMAATTPTRTAAKIFTDHTSAPLRDSGASLSSRIQLLLQ
jgi:hypothetical protein